MSQSNSPKKSESVKVYKMLSPMFSQQHDKLYQETQFIFDKIEHGDMEHRSWLKTELFKAFAELASISKLGDGEKPK